MDILLGHAALRAAARDRLQVDSQLARDATDERRGPDRTARVARGGHDIPVAKIRIKRERETELRHDLWEMRDAIDRYKDAADRGAFQIKLGSEGYPPDLDTLVKGVDVQGKTIRFLRRVPIDPMTGKAEWGMRSLQDDPDSTSWGEQNVFDVYTKSTSTALDGTKYSEW